MGIKNSNIYYSKALQNLPKFGIFGSKTNHLATLSCIHSQKQSKDLLSKQSKASKLLNIFAAPKPGLPDGLFLNQNSQFGQIFEGLRF
jgi:hypothetical protein